jgi:hypothetical protein
MSKNAKIAVFFELNSWKIKKNNKHMSAPQTTGGNRRENSLSFKCKPSMNAFSKIKNNGGVASMV